MATEAATKYVIQFSANTNFCLGVTAANPGAQVTLTLLQGAGTPLTQWYIDPNSGYITLAGADPSSPLYLDFQGATPSNGVPLIVSSFALGRNSQRWNWIGNPPYVMNVGAPNYCIDDSNGGTQPGNRVQIWTQQNGNTNQQWQFLAVPVLEASLAVTA